MAYQYIQSETKQIVTKIKEVHCTHQMTPQENYFDKQLHLQL